MFRILVVDDNESIHEDFKKVLLNKNKDKLHSVEFELFGDDDDFRTDRLSGPPVHYQLDEAFQGEEAVRMVHQAAIKNNPYALVFMDVRMPPGINGVEAIRRIWCQYPETEMVVCTAHSDYSWEEMIEKIGISDRLQFIRKPFDMVTIQQLALSLTKKWHLARETERHIGQLEIENQAKEKAQAELAQLNEELEHRIQQRTAQLHETNQELQRAIHDFQDAQEQLVAAEKMAALGGLVAGVAHEINTPVGVAVTAASHLSKETQTLRSLFRAKGMKRSDLIRFLDTSSEAARIILSNLDRASEQVQSFKQVAVDQSSEKPRNFQVKEYIREVLLSLRPKLKKTRLEIRILGDEKEIRGFPGAFGQVISNFVLNSLLHAYEPNQSGILTFSIQAADRGLTLLYRDNGRGIPAEDLKKIFDPFFTTKRGRGGSGLGLHVVYNIVTRTFGGTISCESELGKGTTFKVWVPYLKDCDGV